jgi:hypothetical protein
MGFQIGAMTVGDILDRGIKLLLARLPTFYAINLIVLSPLLAVIVAIPLMTGEADLGAASGATLLSLLLILILQPIGTAAILQVVAGEFIDQRIGMGPAFAFALRRFGPLLLASIIYGLLVGLGMVLCLVPGLIFLAWYIFVPQVVVVEGVSAGESLSRSKSLTEGYRWRIFGLILLFIVIGLIFQGAISLLGTASIHPYLTGVRCEAPMDRSTCRFPRG